MKRIQKTELIVIKSEKNGENHKLLSLFTEEFGLIRALAFGANSSKSKMRATSTPFCLSLGELYHDPVKDLWRVTQMDGINLYEGIRNNLKKFYTLSFLVEVILKSYGGGDERIYPLFKKTAHLIDLSANDQTVDKLLLLYLWRYLWMNGILPNLSECSQCGKNIEKGESLFYRGEGSFSCSSCKIDKAQQLNPLQLEYLSITSKLNYENALTIELDEALLLNLKNCLILIVQSLVEYPLKSLKSAKGFI